MFWLEAKLNAEILVLHGHAWSKGIDMSGSRHLSCPCHSALLNAELCVLLLLAGLASSQSPPPCPMLSCAVLS